MFNLPKGHIELNLPSLSIVVDVRSSIREDVLRALPPDVADWSVQNVVYYFKAHGYIQESNLLEEQVRAMFHQICNVCTSKLCLLCNMYKRKIRLLNNVCLCNIRWLHDVCTCNFRLLYNVCMCKVSSIIQCEYL